MDWTTITLTAMSTGFIFSLYEAIRFRKENKILKSAEATNASTDSQEKQLDLVKHFYDLVKEVTDESARQSQDNQIKIIESIDGLDKRLDKIDVKVSNLEEYLNGEYHSWLSQKEKKQKA